MKILAEVKIDEYVDIHLVMFMALFVTGEHTFFNNSL